MAHQSIVQMILELLIENDPHLSQPINVKSITHFQDAPQQKAFSLLEQEELARSGLHGGDILFINFNRVLLNLAFEYGPNPSDVYLEQKAAVALLDWNMVA
jgi:hypothetical protein